MAEDWIAVGTRLREARVAMGITQRHIAGVLGITPAAYSYVESGKVGIDALRLQALARLFGRPVGHFLGEDEPAVPEADREALALFAEFLSHRRRAWEGKLLEAETK